MQPDIRIRSVGPACLYGLAALTDAGRKWIETHAVPIGGGWNENTFWMNDRLLPRDELRKSKLVLVCGIGDTDEHDTPADGWL
jgi:hypothetical protein